MTEVGVGVVGCGFVGRGAHVPAISAAAGARLVAVADTDPERLAKVQRKYQVESIHQDYMDLIGNARVDAVIVSAPTPMHAEITLAAIQAGKHVLCEMPLAPDLKTADDLSAAADQQGVYLMPGLTFRFTPNFVKAKTLIQEGVIGKPSAFSYRELIPAEDLARQWPAESWVWNVEQSGGPLFTLSVWSIDLIRWLFDSEVADVQAAVKYTRLERFSGTLGYDAMATLTLANGVVGDLRYSGSVVGSAAECGLEVVGDATSVLRAADNDSLTLFAKDPAQTTWKLRESGPKMWGHQQQDEYFIGCIQAKQPPEITPADGGKAMEVAGRLARPA